MKKTFLLSSALLSLTFVACKKDEAPKPTGSIRYINNSGDTYNIYLDGGAYGQVSPNASKVVPAIPIDSHTVRATQANNYYIKPISKENRIHVEKDKETTFTFP